MCHSGCGVTLYLLLPITINDHPNQCTHIIFEKCIYARPVMQLHRSSMAQNLIIAVFKTVIA